MKPDQQSLPPRQDLRVDAEPGRVTERLNALARAQERLQGLLDAVLEISRELELPEVLRQIVSTAMELVGVRYGALTVVNERRTGLSEFLAVGLSKRERADLAAVGQPQGRGLLGQLIHHTEPMRIDDIPTHPLTAGFPPGHPPMRTLLGMAITVRGEIYGNLYLSERHGGQPFGEQDEAVVVALAGAAGIAIDHARLFTQVRSGAEQFQRLLLPRLPESFYSHRDLPSGHSTRAPGRRLVRRRPSPRQRVRGRHRRRRRS